MKAAICGTATLINVFNAAGINREGTNLTNIFIQDSKSIILFIAKLAIVKYSLDAIIQNT